VSATFAIDSRARWLLRAMALLLLLSATVLQRFGVNGGALSTSLALPVMYGFLAVAGLAGALELSIPRTLLFGACMAVGVASLLLNETDSSFASLALLCAIYVPFAFLLRPGALASCDAAWISARFLDVAAFCALCGVVQFAAQLVVHARWLFDFTPYIPEPLRASGTFNTVIPIGSLNKSNGFFFREPSGFSYVMALGIVWEQASHRRPLRLLLLAAGLLLSYSGTGILALLLAMLHPFGVKTVLRLGVLALLGTAVFWLLGDALNLSFTLGRVNELSADSSESSGYMRYVAPLRLVTETFDQTPWSAWLGHGPGTIFRTLRSYSYHDPTWSKLLFEYGALGFVTFLTLFLLTLRRGGLPIRGRAALFWGWLIMGGHLLSPEQNFMTLMLVGLMPLGSAIAPRQEQPRRLPQLTHVPAVAA
jgi:hypothetical protein